MYSRKFSQNGLPPDYSGISFRQPQTPLEEEKDCSPQGTPRYPTEDRHTPIPPRRFTVKRNPKKETPKQTSPSPTHTSRSSGLKLSSLASHSFTMEDIVLAGLILLLLNSDCDSELLLILGFLLLVGLQ